MSQFGLRIKNFSAGTLYGYNLGVRGYYEYTNAMFHNSLFSDFIKQHGLKTYRGESTRDIICINFDFGLRDYEAELKHIQKLDVPEDKRAKMLAELEENKDKYVKTSRDEIRRIFYTDGVDVDYGNEKIHYKMLYRNASKAKIGQAMFINAKLYKVAYDWLTMGLGKKLPKKNAKIVELSAYAPLTTSTIVGKFQLPLENVLIVKDAESSFVTKTKVVREQKREDIDDYMCVVESGETEVKNVLWDGMGLIDKRICSDDINGMVLLRNHFFKACAFKTDICAYYTDWCKENGFDYETYEVLDMFGNAHKLKDIKLITTENAIKWGKFKDLMGDDPYGYWSERVEADDCWWGIVKTDHPSKLNEVQQMSYQMINTLPCSDEEIVELADISTNYLMELKENDKVFVEFLRRYATIVNHYDMMADLYEWNPEIGSTEWYRSERQKIIRSYVNRLKKGKITIRGDNLTVCGNPYALLMHTVGEDFNNDPTLNYEEGTIQCYTKMFEDGAYLCAIRNPHNSPNNLCYLHNHSSSLMEKYFCFSDNIIAVNCIHSDIQDRANGADFDSDFFFVTDNKIMVENAKKAYGQFPTIVNKLSNTNKTYTNTLEDYAAMDSHFADCKMGIGYSSNLAQLAMTYYWTDPKEEYYDNFVILSVLAQVIIDGCKREYMIDSQLEIQRIANLECMKMYRDIELEDGKTVSVKSDFPEFMKYTRPIKYTTKHGKLRDFEDVKYDRKKLNDRINYSLKCPMNQLCKLLGKTKKMSYSESGDIKDYFIKVSDAPHADNRQMGKIRKLVDKYFWDVFELLHSEASNEPQYVETELLRLNAEIIEAIQKIKISNKKTINRLIEACLGIDEKYSSSKIERNKIVILRVLYMMNPEKFLNNFIKKSLQN